MNRSDAIKLIIKEIGNEVIISANGFISRDVFNAKDKNTNFYMIGSMGLASSIGLGIALKKPKKKIYVFDGDGNILMNLGSLTSIGTLKPKNLVHIIFDNNIHESTGGQPSNSKDIRLEQIAKIVNYKIFKSQNPNQLLKIISKSKKLTGPILILIHIEKSTSVNGRVLLSPKKIKERFMKSI
jgi:sulfopyruvate decarboxylase subunit beta